VSLQAQRDTADAGTTQQRTLHAAMGQRSWIYLGTLALACALQVLGLFLPFMRIDVFIAGGETYSLLHTVWLMWTEGLWGIALLIGGFSVVFPFVKMALLLHAWRGMAPGPGRTHLLLWMGRLGKWSMLDPFTVLVLVMLASDQWAVSATTFLGVYAFLTAVAITMALSMVASVLDERTIREREVAPRPPRRMLLRAAGWRGVIALMALASGIACFVGTLANPFLQINQFLLHGESYGITGAAVTMVRERNWPLAALSCFGLLLMPGVLLLAEAWAWLTPARPLTHLRRRRLIAFAAEWSMLDVMALALGLFLLEGQRFVKTDIQTGLWLLIATALSLWVVGWIGRHTAHVGVQRVDGT
jgi:paraquat-inducible protein A